MRNYYSGKKVLVIAASSGIGRELVAQLDSLGAELYLTARSTQKFERCFGSEKSYHFFEMDIEDSAAAAKILKTVKEIAGRIDIMINLAEHSEFRVMVCEQGCTYLDSGVYN